MTMAITTTPRKLPLPIVIKQRKLEDKEKVVQSQVESYQRLKWNMMLPCLILNIIRYGSRVKWINLENGVAPFPTPRCGSYWKGSFRVTLD